MFAQGAGCAFLRTVLSERLHALRATVGRMTLDITKVTDELVDAEVEVARTDRENVAEAPSDATIFAADHSPADSALTRREIDVLRLMATGETNAGIAARLIISEGTVKSHVKHILRKLGAANRAEAVCRYLRMYSGNAAERLQTSNGPVVPGRRWLWGVAAAAAAPAPARSGLIDLHTPRHRAVLAGSRGQSALGTLAFGGAEQRDGRAHPGGRPAVPGHRQPLLGRRPAAGRHGRRRRGAAGGLAGPGHVLP